MKLRLLTLLCFCLATALQGHGSGDDPPAAKRTAAELDELLGPIALYPDALIALILPAATFPTDIVLSARYVAAEGDLARVEERPWDSSVQALTRYPDTLRWLDENLEWTTQVGDAFIEQPVEVMGSIQQLRARARALGNLVDTPQQRIVQDDIYIRIIPTQAEYIYVPRYDPDVIYYERPSARPLLFFSLGFGVGSWLNYDFDWRRHHLYRGDWHQGWDYSRDNNRDRDRRDRDDDRYINNNLTNTRLWQPDAARHHVQSRHVTAERASTSVDSKSRTQSRNDVAVQGRDHHVGIARPKILVGSQHADETVRRAEQRDGGKTGNPPSGQMAHEKKSGDGDKGHVAQPKSTAPGIAGDGKHSNDARDQSERKNPVHDPEHVAHTAESLSKKDSDVKGKGETENGPASRTETKHEAPQHSDAPGQDAPKHVDVPKVAEQKHDSPKHVEAVKLVDPKHDAPTHVEALKHQDTVKPADSKHDAPKHVNPPKGEPRHEAANPAAVPATAKGKEGDKKKKDDDKKE